MVHFTKTKNTKDPVLYAYGGQKIYQSNIVAELKKCGVKKGDIIFVHSDVSVFGKLGETKNKELFLSGLLDSFKFSVGKEGTILMPTFTYSFCNGEAYDIDFSASKVGAFTEYFRKQPNVSRTSHPIFSVAVWGKHKQKFLKVGNDSFGENSIFDLIYKNNAKIIAFGSSFENSATFLHYVEQKHRIPYRFMKTFKGEIINGGKKKKSEATFFVRYLDRNVELDTDKFKEYLFSKNVAKLAILGGGKIIAVESSIFFDEAWKMMDEDIYFFLKSKPNVKS